MRILLAAAGYDAGQVGAARSYEYYNFAGPLRAIGHSVTFFEYDTVMGNEGRAAMNDRLADLVRQLSPDLLFTVLHTDEIDPQVIEWVSKDTSTVTLNWFCDDQWRFEDFSRVWAPRFNVVATTSRRAWERYRAEGCGNAILTQWACNHRLYRPSGASPRWDVSFVGQAHGHRRYLIGAVRRRGVDVRVWGPGWRSLPRARWYGGRLAQEDMVRVFSESRVNLNFSNTSLERAHRGGMPAWMAPLRRLERVLPAELAFLPRPPAARQLKGRTFEIPGTGGFLMSEPAEELDEYYRPGHELVCFDTVDDLVDRARYYLTHEAERRAIAEAGYRRTLGEHTYEQRFTALFRAAGLGTGAGTR
jgi:spore maturation protein CgeB